jgi:hypothetical protein
MIETKPMYQLFSHARNSLLETYYIKLVPCNWFALCMT